MKDGFYINLRTHRLEYYRKRQLLSAISMFVPEHTKDWFIRATMEYVLRQPRFKCKVRWIE